MAKGDSEVHENKIRTCVSENLEFPEFSDLKIKMTFQEKKPWNSPQKALLPHPLAYKTFAKKYVSLLLDNPTHNQRAAYESEKLAQENQKMEEKLKAFKEMLKCQ